MADQSTATATTTEAAPTAPAPGQPSTGQFTVPQGKVLLDQSDAENYRRYQEQVKELRPFYDRASKSGFKRPEDFDGVDPLVKALKSKGLTPEQAARAFFADVGEEVTPPNTQPPIDIKQLREDLLTETRVEMATERHNDAVKTVPDMLTKAAKEMLGNGASELEVELYADAIGNKLASMRDDKAHVHKFMYPEGHPLRDKKWAPYSPEVIGEVAGALKKKRDAAAGAAKVQTAQAVKSGTTIAAPNTGNGAPDTTGKRPDGRPSVDAVRAKAEAKIAARGR